MFRNAGLYAIAQSNVFTGRWAICQLLVMVTEGAIIAV